MPGLHDLQSSPKARPVTGTLAERMNGLRFATFIDLNSPRELELLTILQCYAIRYGSSVEIAALQGRPIAVIRTPLGVAHASNLYNVWRELREVKRGIRRQRSIKAKRTSGRWYW